MKSPLYILLSVLVLLTACDQPYEAPSAGTGPHSAPDQSAAISPEPVKLPRLDRYFDCLREDGGVLIAAHRGGYRARGYPENTLEALKHTYKTATKIMEIDVSQTRDGVLYLFHDDNFTRLAGRDINAKTANWRDIDTLLLKDSSGNRTDYTLTKLADALQWAVSVGAILELDIKRSAKYADVIKAVRAANASNNVILIAYTDNQAAKLADLAPRMMLTADATSPEDVRRLERRGINSRYLIAWTGIERPNKSAWNSLNRAGVEPAFGTLGRRSDSLDSRYSRDGDLSEFKELANAGVVIIATDMAARVAKVLSSKAPIEAECRRQ